jgi:predicted nucleic acid-binding protein
VFFRSLLALPIRIDSTAREITFRDVFAYAEKYKLTVYDAAYLELAIREGIALATLDNDLRKAAGAAGVLLA